MDIRTVAPGSYLIGKGGPEILSAHLGTTVGVTLCDRRAKIGGLAHLLLPEPSGLERVLEPGIFATTALPIFIRELCSNGATRGRLEASVAGGALIGAPSETDLVLDVGGRTTELVSNILRGEGIPVLQSETGGCWSFAMGLDLTTFECSIDPGELPEERMLGHRFQKPDIRKLKRTIDDLIPIPQTALKILRMIGDSTYNPGDMAREVKTDQVISAKVLRVCNSAYVRPGTRIDSIDRALLVLGDVRLLQLVLSTSLENLLAHERRGYSLCKGGLSLHAMGTALLSGRLAGMAGIVPADLAYTAGLLHDIGKVVLDQHMAAAYPLFYRKTREDGLSLVDAEKELFGMDHAEAGDLLAGNWNFPDNLRAAIRCHHRPEDADGYVELAHTVCLADAVMSRFLAGLKRGSFDSIDLITSLNGAGFSVEQFPYLLDRLVNTVVQDPFLGTPAAPH